MRLFVSGATRTLRRHSAADRLGVLLVPAAGNTPRAALALGLPWAVDNAAFTGFDPAAFCGLLARVAGRPGCRFVACPDVVGDAAATLALFAVWASVLRQLGLPVALVAQDGLEGLPVPWGGIDALFVGGSTDWKLGPAAAELVREAKRRGLWVHFGRCNTRRRFRHAWHLGCDSVDGSGFSRWPDQWVPLALNWLAALDSRPGAADPRAGAFFRSGGGIACGPGWHIEAVERSEAGYSVRARFAATPRGCPACGFADAPPYRHGERAVTVADSPRDGVPVRVRVVRPRFRCRCCRAVFSVPLDPVGRDASAGLLSVV